MLMVCYDRRVIIEVSDMQVEILFALRLNNPILYPNVN